MIRNFFKVAFRNMANHKAFAAINLLGLTTGITACIFILLYVVDEVTYDKFYPNVENIHRMQLHGRIAGQEIHTTTTNSVLGTTMVAEIPGVLQSTRMNDFGNEWIIRKGNNVYAEANLFTADSTYFKVFTHDFIQGSPEGALTGPHKMVITERLANKYFPNESAVGQTLALGDDRTEFMITGVIKDVPRNTHLYFEGLLSIESFDYMNNLTSAWLSNSYITYVTLAPGTDPANVEELLEPIVEQNASPVFKEFMGKTLEEMEKDGAIYRYYSIPVSDIRLYSDVADEPQPQGDINNVYILSAIGLFILIIACINFMNLSTAKSAGRAKEVGLRKTMGSSNRKLVGQFLSESVMYALISTVVALGLTSALMPYFNTLAGKDLGLLQLMNPGIALGVLLIILFIGFLAGTYPAFYLTSFQITETLKGKVRSGMKSGKVRSFLVTFQFWISILLVICTAIVYQQITHMLERNLGFDKERVLMIQDMDRLGESRESFKNELANLTNIEGISYSNNILPGASNNTIFRQDGAEDDHIMGLYFVDEDYLSTLGLEMKEGRFFSKDFPSDTSAAIINEAAVRELNWDNPLSMKLLNFNDGQPEPMNIIGVVKDFNFESIKVNVRPLVLRVTNSGGVLYVRYSDINPQSLISTVEDKWSLFSEGEPMEYTFLDQRFDDLFKTEQRLGTIFTVFTVLAILIACLGLFGLASFTAEQRRKEIGIRKVLGASIWSIILSMSLDFIKLVIIAFVLAIYPAWYIMDRWLSDFSSRVDMSVWVFLVGGFVAIAVAWITVSYQSYQAAKSNPVDSLHYE